MLKGFNPWQSRIAALGLLGLIITVAGFVGPWYALLGTGFSITALSILTLILLGNRQNWRQMKKMDQRLGKLAVAERTSDNKEPKQVSNDLPKIGSAFEYANRIRKNHKHYETFALMSKSIKIRDAFALAATKKDFNYSDLSRFIAVQRLGKLPESKKEQFRHWDRNALLAIARLEANQRARELDLENSVRLFAFVEAMFGTRAMSRVDQLTYLEALGELGDYEKQAAHARRFNIAESLPIQTELFALNAIQAREGAESTGWLRQLNNIYLERGFAPIDMLASTHAKPLDSLRSEGAATTKEPLVSVIVPTFQGGQLLFTALESLLSQSWQNIEIIVVDDASGPEYEQYLDRASKLSPKIRVIKQTENLGAYCARNAGVSSAKGQYITVHDDDDWSHTNKIETQVRHLINNPDIPGNMSAHTRVTDELKFLRINNNPILTQANFSSLMVHKSVFDKIGLWDTVNRGADSEFRTRIKIYFGVPVHILNEVPMSFTRTREGSLTSGELSRGFLDPSRVLYSKAYTQWHKKIADSVESLKPGMQRNFPVPTTMQPGLRNADLGRYDVVFLTDFRFPGGTTSLTLAEIRASAQAGYRVGFIHADSPLNRAQAAISNELFDMQLEGIVDQISLQDRAQIDLLIVRHPSVATFMDKTTTQLTVMVAALIVNNPPVLNGGSGMVFDLEDCVDNIDRIFKTQTHIVAESGVTKSITQGLVPAGRLLDMTWPGLVPSAAPSRPGFESTPVVGRHSRDSWLKWPSTKEEFDLIYSSTKYHTHILGGVDKLTSKLGSQVAEDKTVYGFGEIAVDEFLQDVDFWVYFHDDSLTESFGMSIAEAMAAGKVVILPHYLEASFGDGAIYAEPSEVEELVTMYWSQPQRYTEQSQRARQFVTQEFSIKAFLERIQKLKQPDGSHYV